MRPQGRIRQKTVVVLRLGVMVKTTRRSATELINTQRAHSRLGVGVNLLLTRCLPVPRPLLSGRGEEGGDWGESKGEDFTLNLSLPRPRSPKPRRTAAGSPT